MKQAHAMLFKGEMPWQLRCIRPESFLVCHPHPRNIRMKISRLIMGPSLAAFALASPSWAQDNKLRLIS
jgi:hypothetical protein